MEQSLAAWETNNANDPRIRSGKIPSFWQSSTADSRRILDHASKMGAMGWRGTIRATWTEEIRDFLDWVHANSAVRRARNPGRTSNKVRSHLRAVMSWAWEQDIVEALPRFPKLKPQRDVAGRHYLTKPEISALYFATYYMKRPPGWNHQSPIGRYWRCALVIFFNYGVDTGTIWKTLPFHEPILWRHVSWQRQ